MKHIRRGAGLPIVVAFAVVLLIVTPFIDVAWYEPALDESQGARCHLHANPVVPSESPSRVVRSPAELLAPLELLTRAALLGPSIFVPPRA
jgi:hypothetical protein